MIVIDAVKIPALQDAIVLGETLKSIANLEEGITCDGVVCALTGIFDEIDLDEVGCDENEVMTKIVTFLDSIGVKESLINDLLSEDDEISRDSLTAIAKTFDNNFDADSIPAIALKYANEYNFDCVEQDDMPPRKQGYKRTQVIKNGKKKWVNKRISGKKVKLSPAQKRALMKARMKAHTGASKLKRAKSQRASKLFKI